MDLTESRPRVEAYPTGLATVVIADQHAAARAGIRRALAAGFTILGEAQDADELLEVAHRMKPDLCVIEMSLPGGGLSATRRIAAELPSAAVVVLAPSETEQDFFDALKAGAAGYLLKDLDPARLPHALHGVLAGEGALPRRLLPRLVEEFRGQHDRRRVSLKEGRGPEVTAREWETLELLRRGLTTAEIAVRLCISPVTVRRHLSAAVVKLGVPDRAAAMRLLSERSDRV